MLNSDIGTKIIRVLAAWSWFSYVPAKVISTPGGRINFRRPPFG